MRLCKHYQAHIAENPADVSDICKEHKGLYTEEEVPDNFWQSGGRYWNMCKHCENLKRHASDHVYDPVITKNWPRDENGRLLSYWHIIDKTIIL